MGPRPAPLEDEGGVSPASCGVRGELRWRQAAADGYSGGGAMAGLAGAQPEEPTCPPGRDVPFHLGVQEIAQGEGVEGGVLRRNVKSPVNWKPPGQVDASWI
ncbi:PREDICTED: bladder cancer-associated protein isoform X1 [Rhinopithecus bieti]|uniref:bladder cancer-associated protein isoform X1 n=1 Tax=Rhinopithecus bieti TaxID=61621 RepID=UPI00083C0B18|nr:PREDICTED: bladder cancer-associated protein isoform X1 [Rhinopithecus bieti]